MAIRHGAYLNWFRALNIYGVELSAFSTEFLEEKSAFHNFCRLWSLERSVTELVSVRVQNISLK